MPYKEFIINNDRLVKVYKRRSARSLRMSLGTKGEVKVTIPAWAPYKVGLDFVRSKQDWISANVRSRPILTTGTAIGKAHHLELVPSPTKTRPSSRLSGNAIIISYPSSLNPSDEAVQDLAQKACLRALRRQAQQLLPQRLATLASKHGFDYAEVSVRELKSRWGSCDSHKNIVLSIYLMQLPWELIDYILLHELTHTKVLKHGPEFWQTLDGVLPGAKQLKGRLREYQPAVKGTG